MNVTQSISNSIYSNLSSTTATIQAASTITTIATKLDDDDIEPLWLGVLIISGLLIIIATTIIIRKKYSSKIMFIIHLLTNKTKLINKDRLNSQTMAVNNHNSITSRFDFMPQMIHNIRFQNGELTGDIRRFSDPTESEKRKSLFSNFILKKSPFVHFNLRKASLDFNRDVFKPSFFQHLRRYSNNKKINELELQAKQSTDSIESGIISKHFSTNDSRTNSMSEDQREAVRILNKLDSYISSVAQKDYQFDLSIEDNIILDETRM